jgi:3-isopropylmalate dehydrogenase
MAYQLGVLLGDDIGLEVVPEAVRVAAHAAAVAGSRIDWHDIPVGMQAYASQGTTLPGNTLDRLGELDGWILGPIGHQSYPKDPKAVNPHPILRKHFDLFANIRPIKSFASLASLHTGVDLVMIRENNEGFQPDRNVIAGCGEFRPTEDTTISVRVITRRASANVAIAAFELARQRRKRVVAIHKNTVFKLSCGMFAEECRRVAAEYPDVEYSEAIVDTFAMHLTMKPQAYDVIVTTNLFGDILSDLGAGLVGGLGLAPGLSAGPDHAMAQATHGSAPDIAGKGIANPYAMIASAQLLLQWLGRRHQDPRLLTAAESIEQALDTTMADVDALTPDLGGNATTTQMTDTVLGLITASETSNPTAASSTGGGSHG